MLYLPSKQFIAILVSLFFIIGGGYFVFFYESRSTNQESREEQIRLRAEQSGETSLFAAKDTDGDGLKDWEEVLWGTDLNKGDTDGDGTKDNDEILAKRDPTKAGLPADLSATAPLSGATAEASAEAGHGDEIDRRIAKIDTQGVSIEKTEPQTLTESLARDFGEAYVRQKFGKKEVDEQYLSNILFSDLTNMLAQQNAHLSKQEESAYVEKQDLLVINDMSPLAIKRYINHVGDVLVSSSLQEEKNEIQLVLDAVKEDRLENLQKLLAYRDAYQTTAKRLKETPVPHHLLGTHEAMMNSLWRLGLVAEEMSKFSEDPVGGLTAMNSYMAEAKRSIIPLKTIVAEIKKHNFIFKDNEGGTIFNRYLDIAI